MRITAGLLLCASLIAVQSFSQSTNTNNISGEWNFDSGDLRASVGSPLQFRGDTASAASFTNVTISGQSAGVLRLAALSPEQGIVMPTGVSSNVAQYTLLMDVMWPAESDATWRAILQTDTNNTEDAILFVNPDNAIGINNIYEGSLPANTWHRIAMTFDTINGQLVKYINGSLISTQDIGNSTRFSIGSTALLFSDNDGETAPVLVNSIQLRSVILSPEEIAEIGTPSAGGISGGSGGPVGGDIKIERIQKDGGDVVLTVSGGGTLQLQQSTTLQSGSWQNVGAPTATDTFRVPASEQKAFFRIERR